VAPEVAASQFRQRRVAVERNVFRRALVDEHVGELLAAPRAAGNDLLEFRVHRHVGETLVVGRDSGARKRGTQLDARQRLAAAERALEHAEDASHQASGQFELATVVRADRVHARRGQRQHPPQVWRRHEVPRRTEDVRTENAPVVKRAIDGGVREVQRALCHAPLRARVVLRLHRAEPGDDVLRLPESGLRQLLIAQPQLDDFRSAHPCGRAKINDALVPPKPNELVMAWPI
jgi:hypothetical protein